MPPPAQTNTKKSAYTEIPVERLKEKLNAANIDVATTEQEQKNKKLKDETAQSQEELLEQMTSSSVSDIPEPKVEEKKQVSFLNRKNC